MSNFGKRHRIRPPKIIQHAPRPALVTSGTHDLRTGRQVFPLPYQGVPPTMSPRCTRCGSPAFTLQASGRVFCGSCQQTLGWLEGRIVLGAAPPEAKAGDL